MSTYFEAIRTFFVVMLGLTLVGLFLRRRSADLRHLACRFLLVAAWITPVIGTSSALTSGFSIATLSPAVVRGLPEWTPSSMMPREAWRVRQKPRPQEHQAYLDETRALFILVAVQIGGMALFCVPVLLGWRRLMKVQQSAVTIPSYAGIAVWRATEEGIGVPVVYGRPAKILLPAESVDWPSDRIEAALLHEAAHVRRNDPFWLNTALVLTMMNWWNPALHVLSRVLRSTAEEAADDAVIAAGFRPSDYARELLAVAAHRSGLNGAAISMVEGGVAHRVRAILAPDRDRRRASLALGGATALLVGSVTLAMGSLTTRFSALRIPPVPGAVKGSLWQTTTLPTGDTVKIATLQEFDGARERRWRPEGYEGDGDLPVEIDPHRLVYGLHALVLHIRVGAATPSDRSFRVLAPRGYAWGMDPVPVRPRDGEVAAWDLRQFTKRPNDPLTGDFAVGVASGDRRTLRLDTDARPEARGARSWLNTTVRLGSTIHEQDCAYTFLATDGRRFAAHVPGYVFRPGYRELSVTGWVPKGVQVRVIEVAYRPYVWTMYRNVRLQPNGDVPWRTIEG